MWDIYSNLSRSCLPAPSPRFALRACLVDRRLVFRLGSSPLSLSRRSLLFLVGEMHSIASILQPNCRASILWLVYASYSMVDKKSENLLKKGLTRSICLDYGVHIASKLRSETKTKQSTQ